MVMVKVMVMVTMMVMVTLKTDGLLGGDLLASCKGVGLVSLGRGNICDEEQVISLKDVNGTCHAFV